jgi:hypothetical protein
MYLVRHSFGVLVLVSFSRMHLNGKAFICENTKAFERAPQLQMLFRCSHFYGRLMARDALPFAVRHLHSGVSKTLMNVERLA